MKAASFLAGLPSLSRLRTAFVVAAALLAAYAALGFFAVPWLAKPRIEAAASTELGRRVSLGRLDFNPFTLLARLSDFSLADRDSQRTLLEFESLDVDLSAASIWKWAPVLDAVRLVKPKVELTRNADGSYNIQDLIDRVLAAPKEPTPAFSVNNIEIADGTLTLDDRQHARKVAITNLAIGIPFLSSLPYEAEIHVTPKLEGAIDGARFTLNGNSTTPFADTEEATLNLDFDALPLPNYVAYAPLPQGIRLAGGALTTRLVLAFVTEKGAARTLTLAGAVRLDGLSVRRSDNSALAAAKTLDVRLGKFDPLGRVITIDRIAIDAPEAEVRRDADGKIEFERLLDFAAPTGKASGATGPPAGNAPARRWTFAVGETHVADGVLHLSDEGVSPAFRVTLSKVALDATRIASSGEGAVDVAFDSDSGAHFAAHSSVDVGKQAAQGHFAFTAFRLALLYPYYASALNLDVRGGTLDFAGDFSAGLAATPLQFTLTAGAATMANVDMAVPGESDPLWRVPHMELAGVAFDNAKRSVTIDRVESQRPMIHVMRQSDGVINFDRLIRTNAATGTQAPAAPAAREDAGWSVLLRKTLLEHMTVEFEDHSTQPPVKLKLADARIAMDNYSNARAAKGTVDFTARPGAGRLQFTGGFATNPVSVDGKVAATGVDLVPLRPYFEAKTNVIVTGGAVGTKGHLTYGGGQGLARTTYSGDLSISDFNSLDSPTSQELLKWRSLTFTGIDVASEPLKIGLGAVALDDFYARVIVNPDATLNLQHLFAPEDKGGAASVDAPSDTDEVAKATTASPPEPKELPISIGQIRLSGGEVQFSDFFVKPNYSAHLTALEGTVSTLSSTQAGDIDLAARVENAAPVEIRGSLNPFARDLMLDVSAKAQDIDLPPLTPYSAKYAGYGIQKGKLSFEVQYKVENRKLAASNKLALDQLTFGEHVDSPSATKLPVLLAVALLKDRNGVIRLDLPIEGTLDDPKFSMGRVIVQIIVNVITKIVTAPFAILGAIAGGSHAEQLAYVEFAPGRAELSPAAEEKLRSLSKAMVDRPAVKLDAAGRAVPEADRDGLQRAALDRALRVQKQKALAGQGESAPAIETLTIDAAEYPKYLALVYRDAELSDKPRNVIGLPKDIPPAEMEALLLKSYRADDEALRQLANRRAQVVKEWFVGPGGVASERVFVVAAKLNGEGITDKGPPTRVDFAIR